jgi:glycine/D-amino acid oxidase-like deaminating enzyme/nitrite reductase/ring-hydroxylating ferredoxin subunit
MDWLSPDSYWHATSASDERPQFDRQEGNAEAEVVIVGAGITGLTTALHVQAAGLRVMILEAGRVGAGTTGGTSAHLDAVPDQGADELIRKFGEASARQITAGRMAAIDQIETWCREFEIDCDFRRIPAYFYSESESGAKTLMKQADSLRRLGLSLERAAAVDLPFAGYGGLRIDHQGRFHSLRYLRGLARVFHGRGGVIHEHTPVQPPAGKAEASVETAHGRISASRGVVLCTHSPFLGPSQFDARVAAYQSYVLTARIAEEIPDALFWDDAEPYHYLRRAASDDPHLIIAGGADHKTGQGGDERESVRQLEEYVRERFTVEAIEQRWSAEFHEPDDGIPYIGAVPRADRLWMSTGYSGTGLSYGTMAGRLLSDLLLERENPLAEIVRPSRVKPLAAAKRFVTENVNVAQRFIGDRVTADSIQSLQEIRSGQGRLVRYRGRALAAYRSEDGHLHTLSPACTHMGCFVQWNEQEHTWDCPCHGGRYTATGERVYGPPPRDLEPKPPEGQSS